MASDFEQAIKKIIDLTIKTEHLTSDILKAAMRDFLSGNSQKKGRISMRQLSKQANGKLEKIEVSDDNIRDFLATAKKYDVDFAVRRDKGSSAETPTYHVLFSANKAENFKKAFAEYAGKKAEITAPKRGEISRTQLKAQAQQISRQPRKEKVRERAKEVSH